MERAAIDDIGTAVSEDVFPDVDLALRRGRHIDRDDTQWYAFLIDAQGVLEEFYRRFGCELVHKSEGYFYLLPTSDRLGKRQLSAPEMLVGQALALLYLDPSTVQNGGVVTRDDVLGHMASVMGTDALMRAFNPNKKRIDERVAQEAVRNKVAEGLRKLGASGFVEVLDNNAVRLRSALMRFAEPVRGSESPADALAKLVARGEVLLEGSAAADVHDHELETDSGDEQVEREDRAESLGDDFDDEHDGSDEPPSDETDGAMDGEPPSDSDYGDDFEDFEETRDDDLDDSGGEDDDEVDPERDAPTPEADDDSLERFDDDLDDALQSQPSGDEASDPAGAGPESER